MTCIYRYRNLVSFSHCFHRNSDDANIQSKKATLLEARSSGSERLAGYVQNGIGVLGTSIQVLHGFFGWKNDHFNLAVPSLTPDLVHYWQCSGTGANHQMTAFPRYLFLQREWRVTETVFEFLRCFLLALADLPRSITMSWQYSTPSIRIFPNEKCSNFMAYQPSYRAYPLASHWSTTAMCDLSASRRSGSGRARKTWSPWPPLFGTRPVQSSCKRVESWCGSVPAQLIHVVKERDVRAERGQCPE